MPPPPLVPGAEPADKALHGQRGGGSGTRGAWSGLVLPSPGRGLGPAPRPGRPSGHPALPHRRAQRPRGCAVLCRTNPCRAETCRVVPSRAGPCRAGTGPRCGGGGRGDASDPPVSPNQRGRRGRAGRRRPIAAAPPRSRAGDGADKWSRPRGRRSPPHRGPRRRPPLTSP